MRFYQKLLLVCLFSLFVSDVFAQLVDNQNAETKENQYPVIAENIDRKLFEGSIEEIKSHIDQRKKYINRLIAQLNHEFIAINTQRENTKKLIEKDDSGTELAISNNSKLNKSLAELVEKLSQIKIIIGNFNDVNYKHLNLIQELESNTIEDFSIEIIQPYTIESVNKLNDFIEEISDKKNNHQVLIEKSTQRLNKLTGVLNDLVTQYSILLSDNSEPLKTYTTIRNIYLYQADYALLNLKNLKYTQIFEVLSKQLKINEELLPSVIENIQSTNDTLVELSNQHGKLTKKLNALQKEHARLNRDFDKISFKAELELDNLESKINNSDDQSKIEILLIQKQINLTKIEYSYFIKNLLQQKELSTQIRRDAIEFKSTWLIAYNQRKTNKNGFKEMIKAWQDKLSAVAVKQDENTQLLESLNRSILEIGRQQNQVQGNTNINSTFIKHKKTLIKQLDKNIQTIQRLSLVLNSNINIIEQSTNKNTRILAILSQQLNKIEQIGQWFGDKFKAQIEKIKNILYYPIASFGDKPFTLLVAIQVLFFVIVGFVLLRFFRKKLTSFLSKRTGLSEGASHSISTLIYYLGGFLVFLSALSAAGFNLSQMMIVFGALGVGIGFGLQNIANNFISGMILLIDRTLTVGDSITLSDGTHGKVAKLAMRYTVIRTNGGYDIIVPNSELIANRVTSMTFDDNYLRLEIPFGVSYDSDPEQVRDLTLEVANKVKHTINRETQTSAVIFNGFGDNSLDFVLRVWVFIYDRYRPYAIKSDYYFKLFKAFKDAGIEIPYPQRDLHIRGIDKEIVTSFKNQHDKKDNPLENQPENDSV